MALLQREDCHVIKASAKETGVVLFLHGLGDTGYGYPSHLEGCCPPHVRIICPTALKNPVSVNNGYRMPSWFDVYELKNNKEREDEGSLRSAVKDVHEALDAIESSGTPSSRIVVGGISQGGALAAFATVTYKRPLAGLLLLSSWLPIKDKIHKEVLDINKDTPILQCHGKADPLIIYKSAQEKAEFFKSLHFTKHELRSYPDLVHTIGPKELDDIKEWLPVVLP